MVDLLFGYILNLACFLAFKENIRHVDAKFHFRVVVGSSGQRARPLIR